MDGQYWKGDRTMSTNEWLLTSDFWQFLEPWHGRWYEYKIFIASCTDNIYDLEKRGDCWGTWLIMLGFMDLGWPRVYRCQTSVLFNNGSGGIDIFEVKLTFKMLTVRWQQHSFSTHERMFLWNYHSFWDRKCLDLRGTRTPNLRIMPNALTTWAIRARHLLSHVFE